MFSKFLRHPAGGGSVSASTSAVYLNLREISEVHEKDVFLRDVADVYCKDPHIQNRCNLMKIRTLHSSRPRRYVCQALDVISLLESADSTIQVTNIGKVEFIIDYQPPHPPKYFSAWAKTLAVCLIAFCGSAFAIMTFNNDVNVTDVFSEVYHLVTGQEKSGFTVLEASYSLGLAIGILTFFNHVLRFKLNTDPTPLEVEMRLYEENICKTLIQNDSRKEQDIDVH